MVRLSHALLEIEREVLIDDGTSPSSLAFSVPDAPVGVYALALTLLRPGDSEPRTSNRLALSLGPRITTALPMTVTRDAQGAATITLTCSPEILPNQRVSLVLGDVEVLRESVEQPSASLRFVLESAVPGERLVRLRVDGIESAIVDRSASPPRFFDHRVHIQ